MKYRIKLNDNHNAKADQNISGYLGWGEGYGKLSGVVCIYSRGEAIKKARVFGGKIEPVPFSKITTDLVMRQVPERLISGLVLDLLKDHKQFNDATDMGEGIYGADIFMTLLAETTNLSDVARLQLGMLSQMFDDVDYVMFTK